MAKNILVFEIDERPLGVSADLVVEVVRAVTPLSLPRVPETVMGIINLRGEVVPVLDTRKCLRLPAMPVRHTDHLVIIRDDGLRYALHADRAVDLATLQSEASDDGDESATPTGQLVKTTLGFVQLLTPSDLLDAEDRSALASIVSSSPTSEKQG
ncbi:Chemotaxis protein CheW [Stieleria maiorica]|uniref:Chemotaxis protein CheW n=1 Tax=Stieleria maiorica TaxID=2795974 RepID=A0A5B9MBG9_9BACT|nr:chemotaxis protein CheW [Stieleria maiorica]QEF98621.1 Chemotaxis protein CheW [Stieleria maiorica]